MKIGCFVAGCSRNRDDQYTTCRSEGRVVINAGFGFALLGHEVDISNAVLRDAKSIFPGVNLRSLWDTSVEYDVAYVWNPNRGSFPFNNYKKLIYMVEPSAPVEKIKTKKNDFPRVHLFTALKLAVDRLNKLVGGVGYFPALFPIPSYPGLKKQDFQDFHFDKNKKDINVWVFLDSWPGSHIQSDPRILDILRRLRDHHGYRMKVTVHRNSGNILPPACDKIIKEFSAQIINNKDVCYLDMLNIFSSMDICITKGGTSYAGNCASDIISLGKLMIYTTEGRGAVNINNLYDLDDYVIRQEDDSNTVHQKVDRIIADPFSCYSAMKKRIVDWSFPEWRKIVTPILEG